MPSILDTKYQTQLQRLWITLETVSYVGKFIGDWMYWLLNSDRGPDLGPGVGVGGKELEMREFFNLQLISAPESQNPDRQTDVKG